MNDKLYLTFDKSSEDIPTLVVSCENFSLAGPSFKVINIITGDEAVKIWNDLNKKAKRND